MQFWTPQFRKGVNDLKCDQSRTTKLVEGLEVVSCEEGLGILSLSCLERRRLRGDFISLLRRSGNGSSELSWWDPGRRFMGMVQKYMGRFRLDIRKPRVWSALNWSELDWILPLPRSRGRGTSGEKGMMSSCSWSQHLLLKQSCWPGSSSTARVPWM